MSHRCYENPALIHRTKARGPHPLYISSLFPTGLGDLVDDPDLKNMVEAGLTGDLCELFRRSMVFQRSAVSPRQVPEPEAGLLSRLVSEDPAASFPLDPDWLFGISSPHLFGNFDSGPKKILR